MNRPIAIAHRGAPLLRRENTLASFAAAINHGADWIELDVHLTRDGEVVVVHEQPLERLWGIPDAVASLSAAQIRTATGDGVPLLSEAVALAAAAGVRLIVDVSTPEIAVAAAAATADVPDRQIGFTGDPDGLALIRRLRPETTLLLSWESLDLPDDDLLERARPQYFNQDARLLRPGQVRHFHDRGMGVSTYTVDRAEDIDLVLAAGVDAVISNDIRTLRSRIDALAPAR